MFIICRSTSFSNQLNQEEKDYAESRSGNNYWKKNNMLTSFSDIGILTISKEKMKMLKEKYKCDINYLIYWGVDETNVSLREVFNFWELQNLRNKSRLTKKDVDRINYLQERINYYFQKREKYTKFIQDLKNCV